MHGFLIRLPRKSKRFIMLASDLMLLPLAFWTATALRLGSWFPDIRNLWWVLLLAPVITIPILIRASLYRAVVRYMEDKVIFVIFWGVTLSVLLLVAVVALAGVQEIPRSAFVIYWLIALLYIGGSRLLARAYIRRIEITGEGSSRTRVAIYGAGQAGVQLAATLQHTMKSFLPVAFFDENPDLQGCEISGIPVFSPERLSEILEEEGFSTVLLALPSVPRKRRQEIIREIEKLRLSIKTIPGIVDLVSGKAKIDEIRDVEIEDLLGRDAVPPVPQLLYECIQDKAVLVTGAGGSIGSELCRQILLWSPRRLVLFEMSELALYQIERELNTIKAKTGSNVEVISILGSVTHRHRVEAVLRSFEIQTIYHAAAYKHVPLVEHNPIEGVRNNVFGTWHVAEAARSARVETFVLISTDKAVRPTNAMGASKRFAELILQGLSELDGATRYCMVRFGNVLGSSGSVVPLFRKQIQEGGPVTVTHPDIIRYFMTIPEAAQLVLQAGSMGLGGDVFVLDMGSPVKIVDLARRMIHLSGLEVRDEAYPDGDVAIEFTGLRPGEKLYEELLIGDNVSGTEHPLIMRAEELRLPWTVMQSFLSRLDVACHAFDCQKVREILLEAVDGYQPQCEIRDHVWAVSSNA